jgi:hypothetical protein
MSGGKVALLVVGSLVLLIGVCLFLGGGALVVVEGTVTDEAGFVTARSIHLDRDSYAITAPARIEGGWPWWWGNAVTVRVEAQASDPEKPLFLGIGERRDVESYLAGVPYAEISGYELHPHRVVYRDQPGTSTPQSPTAQRFWRASAIGAGTQALTWNLEPGAWVLVLMNADGSKGVALSGSIGARAPWLLGVGIGLLAGGVALLALGILLVFLAARGTRTGIEHRGPEPTLVPPLGYPLVFKGEKDESLSPGLWLIKWFLLIPHYIVLALLWVAFSVSWVISLFAILFTSRYPRGLFEFNVGVLRWTWRVGFYGYQALATDEYPPFTLKAGGYPADLDVPYPERLSRGLALVKWWLLAIPHYLILTSFQGGWGPHYGGLVIILSLFGAVALLFTGKYPKDLFHLVLGMNRWSYRVLAYAGLMTDRYPPFRLEE